MCTQQEKGRIQRLYNHWWKKRVSVNDPLPIEGLDIEAGDDCPTKRHKSLNEMASSLGVVNIGGIFVVLASIHQSRFIRDLCCTGANISHYP